MSAGWWPMQEIIQKSISLKKRSAVNVQQLQCSQQADIRQCAIPSHTIRGQGDSAQSTAGDTVACVAKIHSIPRGNEKTKRKPTARWEVPISSPRWAGNLEREVTPEPTSQDADNCTVKIVIVPGALNITSARGST